MKNRWHSHRIWPTLTEPLPRIHTNQPRALADGVSENNRSFWRVVMKALFSAGCVLFLFQKAGTESFVSALLELKFSTALQLFLLLCGLGVVQSLRWWLIGRRMGLRWPAKTAIELGFIGSFFSQLMPSSSGGDAVRAWKLTQVGVPLRKAVSSVFIDRLSALFTLGLVLCSGISVIYHMLEKHIVLLDAVRLYMASGSIIIIAMVFASAIFRFHFLRNSRPIQVILKLIDDTQIIAKCPSLLIVTTTLSLTIQIGITYIVWRLAWDYGAKLDFLEFGLLWPVILLLTFLPISIAGWGVREGAMVVAFHILGHPPSLAIATSVAFGLLMIAASLPGGIVWFATSFRKSPVQIGLDSNGS